MMHLFMACAVICATSFTYGSHNAQPTLSKQPMLGKIYSYHINNRTETFHTTLGNFSVIVSAWEENYSGHCCMPQSDNIEARETLESMRKIEDPETIFNVLKAAHVAAQKGDNNRELIRRQEAQKLVRQAERTYAKKLVQEIVMEEDARGRIKKEARLSARKAK